MLLTHALAFSASQYVHNKKSPHLYEYALGGIRIHETDLYQLEDNLIRHRGEPYIYGRGSLLLQFLDDR